MPRMKVWLLGTKVASVRFVLFFSYCSKYESTDHEILGCDIENKGKTDNIILCSFDMKFHYRLFYMVVERWNGQYYPWPQNKLYALLSQTTSPKAHESQRIQSASNSSKPLE